MITKEATVNMCMSLCLNMLPYLTCVAVAQCIRQMLFLLKINLFCRSLRAGKSKIKVPAGSVSGKGLRLSFQSRVLKLHLPEGTNSLSLHGKSEGREKEETVQP